MAIAVSQAYKDVHARRGGKVGRVVIQYKRRLFDPVAVAFGYEPNWHILKQRDFVDPGEIVDQLDVAEPNVFKSTTVTLRLKNTMNQWVRSVNDPSVFAADALAPSGYYDDQTIFQILYGHLLPNGTWEDCPQFTGYAFDYTPLLKQGFMEVAVSASLLAEKCTATRINSAVTGEAMTLSVVDEPLNPSPGDGTTALLKSTSTGVISVANMKANGVALILTTDYTVSIPTDGTAAKFTLVSPAAQNGKVLTWSGVTKNLLTTSLAITSVSKLYASAVALVQGVDYTVSIPTNVVGPAQITLTDPELWVGKTFTWDGTKGVLNKTVEAAVALYCDAAGIGSSSRSIQPVIFPGGLSSSKTLDSEADWETGTLLQNVSTTAIPGSLLQKWFLVDDWSGTLSKWTVIKNLFTMGISGGLLNMGCSSFLNVNDDLYIPLTGATGTWQFPVTGNSGINQLHVRFMDDGAGNNYALVFSGNICWFTKNDVPATGSGGWGGTIMTSAILSIASQKLIRVTRDSSGVMNVYNGGVLLMSATDTTNTTSTQFRLTTASGGSGTGSQFWVGTINYATDVDGSGSISTSAVAEYQFNLLSTPVSLGTLDHFEALNGGAIVLKTACAPNVAGSPGTYDALQVLGAGNQMASTPRQWLKIRIEISSAAGSLSSPELEKLVAHFVTAGVTLSQVAPTSGTAWDKIQSYAKMCNYETGWDQTGMFYFRSRTVSGDAVIDLDPWTNIIDVDDTHPGWDRVFNIGHASQTPYEYFYGKTDAGEAEPTSERRFGALQRDLDFSSELVANDAQIGQAAAQTAYQDNFRPRWRCRVPSKFIPWLQLSDAVSLTVVNNRLQIESIAGDPLQKSGFAGPQGVALAIKKKMKIIGRTARPKATTADLLLEEILS